MRSVPTPPLPDWLLDIARDMPPLLTPAECARVLRVNESTIRRYVTLGHLLGVRSAPGRGAGRVLIPRHAVLQWLRDHARPE